jgi:hypothetical protein
VLGPGGEVGEVDAGGLRGGGGIEGEWLAPRTLFRLDLSDRSRLDACLLEQSVVEGLIGGLGGQAVVGVAAQRLGDGALVGGVEEPPG